MAIFCPKKAELVNVYQTKIKERQKLDNMMSRSYS